MNSSKLKFLIVISVGFLFVIFVLSLALGCFYTVEQGYRGVILRFGKVIEVSDPGLHFKAPIIDSVHKMSVRTQKAQYKLVVYSKDVQGAEAILSVNFALNPSSVGNIYTVAGTEYVDKILTPKFLSTPKDIFGKYNAVNIVQFRERLTNDIQKELENQFKETGIIIQSVQLENIDFSDSYEKSVEERMKAEVEVQKIQQNLEREKINADMVRAKAKGEADARLAKARAEAQSIELIGKAEAEAIHAKSQAMKENPGYIQLIQAEKWNGHLPQQMIPNSAVPILK